DLAKAIAVGKSTFDAQQAQACLDGLHARKCGRTPPAVDQACERAVRGTVAAGAACNWIYECASGRCEPESAGACPAKCVTAAGAGASCSNGPCDLRAGLRCIGSVCRGFNFTKTAITKGTCTALGDVGAGCVASAQVTGCAEGLLCSGGKCVEKPVSGPCAQDGDCKEGVAYCDGAACRLLKGAGQACAASTECESRFCDPDSGKCVETSTACHEP